MAGCLLFGPRRAKSVGLTSVVFGWDSLIWWACMCAQNEFWYEFLYHTSQKRRKAVYIASHFRPCSIISTGQRLRGLPKTRRLEWDIGLGRVVASTLRQMRWHLVMELLHMEEVGDVLWSVSPPPCLAIHLVWFWLDRMKREWESRQMFASVPWRSDSHSDAASLQGRGCAELCESRWLAIGTLAAEEALLHIRVVKMKPCCLIIQCPFCLICFNWGCTAAWAGTALQ